MKILQLSVLFCMSSIFIAYGMESFASLPKDLQRLALIEYANIQYPEPLRQTTIYVCTDDRFQYHMPTTAVPETTCFDVVSTGYSVSPYIGGSGYYISAKYDNKWYGPLEFPMFEERKTDNKLCDITKSCAAVAFSYPCDDNHIIGIIRKKKPANWVGKECYTTENDSILTKQPGTVTSLALHKLDHIGYDQSPIHRLVYTAQRGNPLFKCCGPKSQTSTSINLFDIDDRRISSIVSLPAPCTFKELFPLNKRGRAYLGLDTEGAVWSIHLNSGDKTMSYSKKKTAEPISHIAVNTEHATPLGFYPLAILLMGNRLMCADLALNPKTALFELGTIPNPEKVVRLTFDNQHYGVVCKKNFFENLFSSSKNQYEFAYVKGTTESISASYVMQKIKVSSPDMYSTLVQAQQNIKNS